MNDTGPLITFQECIYVTNDTYLEEDTGHILNFKIISPTECVPDRNLNKYL